MYASSFCLVLVAVTSTALAHTTVHNLNLCKPAQDCLRDLAKARQQQHNINLVCKSLEATGSCLKAIQSQCPNFKKAFNIANIKLDAQEMNVGCEGACGQAADTCLAPVVIEMKKDTTYSMAICRTMTSSFHCLENLPAKTCKKNIKTAITAFSKFEKEQQFSGYCDDQGNPSACFKNFKECSLNIKPINSTTDWKLACRASEIYLQCESRVQCKESLKKAKAAVRAKLENIETKYKCPTVGSCNDRIQKCASNASIMMNTSVPFDKHRDELCPEIKTTIKCFDFVRKDPICVVDAGLISDTEKKFRAVENQHCGAASIIISSSLVLLAVALSMFKNHL